MQFLTKRETADWFLLEAPSLSVYAAIVSDEGQPFLHGDHTGIVPAGYVDILLIGDRKARDKLFGQLRHKEG